MSNYLNSNFNLDSSDLIEVLDEMPFWSAPFGLKLLENIRLSKNIKALDIGFGAGFPLTEIAMRFGNTCKVYGLDPWEAATNRAKKKLEIYGIKNTEIITGVAENIPLPDNSIDIITSNNGINNVQDLNKTIAECSRVIKSSGQFVQTVNLDTSMIEFYNIMENILSELKLDSAIPGIKAHIYEKRKPLDEFLSLLEEHEFRIDNVIEDKFEYRFVDGTTMLNHYFIQLAFLESWKNLIPLERQVDVFNRIEDNMNEIASEEGYFKLSIPFVLIDCSRK